MSQGVRLLFPLQVLLSDAKRELQQLKAALRKVQKGREQELLHKQARLQRHKQLGVHCETSLIVIVLLERVILKILVKHDSPMPSFISR